jgi:hypothetical protein
MINIIKYNFQYFIFVTMFRKIIATVFLLTFVAQTFSAPFIILDYYTNTGAYAKTCINKARPKMHCNGKCQVMKKMKEEEKKEQENAERRGSAKSEVLSTKSFYPTLTDPEFINIGAIKNAATCNLLPRDHSFDFFKPPRLS